MERRIAELNNEAEFVQKFFHLERQIRLNKKTMIKFGSRCIRNPGFSVFRLFLEPNRIAAALRGSKNNQLVAASLKEGKRIPRGALWKYFVIKNDLCCYAKFADSHLNHKKNSRVFACPYIGMISK